MPSVCTLEVFQRVLSQRGEDAVFEAVGGMLRGTVVDLDTSLATAAALIGADLTLAPADSVVLATARAHGALVWTGDAVFDGLPGARFVQKRS